MSGRSRRPHGGTPGSHSSSPHSSAPHADTQHSPRQHGESAFGSHGSGGRGVGTDTDSIDVMSSRLDATRGRVDSVASSVRGVTVGPESMGVVGTTFTSSAQAHLSAAQQHLARASQAVDQAQRATRSTAAAYRGTDRAGADRMGGIDTTSTPPRVASGSGPVGSTAGTSASGAGASRPEEYGGSGRSGGSSIADRLGGGDDGPPPDRPTRTGGADEPRQPDRNPATPHANPQSLGRFDESRLTRGGDGRITHVDGVPVREKLHQIARDRAQQFHNEKYGIDENGRRQPAQQNADLSGGRTGNIVAHVMDTRTGEVFETTNGAKGTEIPPSQVHPQIQQRIADLRAAGPYPDFDPDGNPIPGTSRPVPGQDLPLRHAEVRGANELLHANPDARLSDLIADTTFLREGGLKDAPFCANCSGILGDVPSNSGRRVYNPQTGRLENRDG